MSGRGAPDAFVLRQVDFEGQRETIRELFWEYLRWGDAQCQRTHVVRLDIDSMIEADMRETLKFMPPEGRLYTAHCEGHVAGIGCLKRLDEGVGEIKRMYVRPRWRGRNIGGALLDRLISDARAIGYVKVRLDSLRFMEAAHRLYRARGFVDIAPYVGNESPDELTHVLVFMELELRGGGT